MVIQTDTADTSLLRMHLNYIRFMARLPKEVRRKGESSTQRRVPPCSINHSNSFSASLNTFWQYSDCR